MIHLLVAVVCLAINFFFVLAEFAFVRVRSAQVEALIEAGDPRARLLRSILAELDDYLSVAQIGVTGATLGIGVVIDKGLERQVEHWFGPTGPWGAAATVATSFLLASFITILLSELLPKALAIRYAEVAALRCAQPMRYCHLIFYPVLRALTWSARLLLRAFGLRLSSDETPADEEELRIILSRSQEGGVMPFRRLLMFENVFDLAELRVRDAMRPRDRVKVIEQGLDHPGVLSVIRSQRFSRYPLVRPGAPPQAMPLGIIHAKDALCQDPTEFSLDHIRRDYPIFSSDTPMERALDIFQRSRNHLGVVTDAEGAWIGILTFEDVIEEIVGQIEDEFERDEALYLDQALVREAIALDLPAGSLEEAVGQAFRQSRFKDLPPGVLPAALERQLRDREHAIPSYVGQGIAIPHLRVEGLVRPLLGFARTLRPVPVPGRGSETARLLFLVFTPHGAARVHLRLIAKLAHLSESSYILERLTEARTPQEVVEAIADGDRMLTG